MYDNCSVDLTIQRYTVRHVCMPRYKLRRLVSEGALLNYSSSGGTCSTIIRSGLVFVVFVVVLVFVVFVVVFVVVVVVVVFVVVVVVVFVVVVLVVVVVVVTVE